MKYLCLGTWKDLGIKGLWVVSALDFYFLDPVLVLRNLGEERRIKQHRGAAQSRHTQEKCKKLVMPAVSPEMGRPGGARTTSTVQVCCLLLVLLTSAFFFIVLISTQALYSISNTMMLAVNAPYCAFAVCCSGSSTLLVLLPKECVPLLPTCSSVPCF